MPARQLTRLACAAVLVAACAPAAAPRGPSPVSGPAPVTAPVPMRAAESTASWRVRRGALPDTVRISTATEFESRVDTLRRVDSAFTEVIATLTESGNGFPHRLTGAILAHRTGVRGDSLAPSAGVLLPILVSAEQRSASAQPSFVIPEEAACAPASAAAQGVRDAWLSLPAELGMDARWRDSTAYRICRDSVPLDLVVVREFRVTGSRVDAGGRVVTLERTHLVSVAGRGTQFGEPITISGSGAGTMRFEVLLDGALILGGEGESTLELRLVGSRKTQELHQRSRTIVHER